MGLSEDSYFIFHNPRIVRGRLSAGVEQALHAQNSRELESEGKIRCCFPRGVRLPEERREVRKYFLRGIVSFTRYHLILNSFALVVY